MKYFSLFSGIGGFELGITQAYENHRPNLRDGAEGLRRGVPDSEEQPLRLTCVGFSEIDKYAVEIYQKHFPEHKNYGDITRIDTAELPAFDILVGGFPCQAFSIAGKRKGFDDTRGTLFFEIARILRDKQPRLLLLENVKGLLSHDGGKTFSTIISTLTDLGYDLQWQVLNSKNWVPQNRERVFIVGHLRGTSRPEVFPFREDGREADELPRHVSNTLTRRYEGAQGTGSYIGEGELDAQEIKFVGGIGTPRLPEQAHLSRAHKQPSRVYDPSGISPTLSSGETQGRYNIVQVNQPKHSNDRVYAAEGIGPTLNTMQGGRRQPKIAIPEAVRGGYSEATVGDSINLAVMGSKTRRGRVGRGVAQTLDRGMQQHTLTSDMRIRRLTPMECERLQGFPDNWTAGVSDSQRYKCLGNAVTVDVIRAIIECINGKTS